ncbi:MAG TPA: flagellar hook-associated protein FlgL [Microthrixaceae bacterium]|nr:flagellar hook-associated protein FlgL [Microthrixaceae bacterium]
MNRVTTTTSNRLMLSDLNKANLAMIKAQQKMSSQKQISKASDDPAQSLVALGHRGTLQRSSQFQRNATDARSWMVAGDTALTSSVEEITHVRTLVIQARSGASDPNARRALAAEVDTVREGLLALANTKHLGRPIFAGTADSSAAFDAAGNYLGDNNSVKRPIGPEVAVEVNRTGTNVFGTSNPGDPLNGNVFEILDSISAAINSGDDAGMANGITALDTAMKRIESAQVELGARARQVDDVMARMASTDIDTKQALSEVEDVDIAQAMIDASAKDFSYKAALSTAAKVMQMSLLDFLR